MSVPILILNPDDPLPAYEQIKMQLRNQIGMGHLRAGTYLPSVRQLARDLGIAPNTVVHAYADLERDQWIKTIARKGVMVNPDHPLISVEERTRQIDEAITHLLTTAHRLNFSAEELLPLIQYHLSKQDKER